MKSLLLQLFGKKSHRLLLFVIVLSMCLATVASQLEIFALGLITQNTTGGGGKGATDFLSTLFDKADEVFGLRSNLAHMALFLLFVALFKASTMFAHRYSTKLASIRISQELRQKYFEHIQTLPMSFYHQYNMGTLSSRVVSDAVTIAEAFNSSLVIYIQTPFTVLTTLILCFMTSWKLSLFILLGFPLIMLPIWFLSRGVKRVSKQIQGVQEKFAGVILDFIGGIQTIKVFAMEDFSLKKYQEHNEKMAKLEKKCARYDLSTRPVVHTLAMVFLATSLIMGLYVFELQIGEVLFFTGMLYLFYEPIKKFAEENSHIQRGVAAAERMLEVIAIKPATHEVKGSIPIKSFNQEISFKNVFFKYNNEWILKGLTFSVKKGEKVAIVGPTGAGKSTVLQLLPLLYEVEEGSIEIDGIPLSSYKVGDLRELIAFVPQRPFLFMGTIAENIAFGRDFSLEEIKNAAKKAHASEFIEKMANGYETEVSEGGKNLSGGQQQRLAIARALVKNAPILIMDEATSSLDAFSEEQIKLALKSIKGEVTEIIVAHRLTTIEDADKIIYLDHGVKLAEGSLQELIKSCPPFKEMWDLLHKKK